MVLTSVLVKIRSRMRTFFRDRRTMRVQGDITRELRKAHKVHCPPLVLQTAPEACLVWAVVGCLQESTFGGLPFPSGV